MDRSLQAHDEQGTAFLHHGSMKKEKKECTLWSLAAFSRPLFLIILLCVSCLCNFGLYRQIRRLTMALDDRGFSELMEALMHLMPQLITYFSWHLCPRQIMASISYVFRIQQC